MKLLKLLPVAALTLVMASTSCSNKTTGAADKAGALVPFGDWSIVSITVSDTVVIDPLKSDSPSKPSVTLNRDSTYGIHTDCNSIAGSFVLNGNSITFDPNGMGISTMMVCPDMTIEDNLKAMLPQVNSYTLDVTATPGDTVLTLLTSTPSQYIKLKKK